MYIIIKYLTLLSLLLLFIPSSSEVAYAETAHMNVSGNKVIVGSTKQFIPYGISVYGGLEQTNYRINTRNDLAQIKAASKYWHSNTIRLQVAESNLFSNLKNREKYNKDFLAAINQQISFAHSLNMVVVVNDQTEFTNNSPNPTQETVDFWKVIADKYKTKPYVIFDIFNEPRITTAHPNYFLDKEKQSRLLFTYSANKSHRLQNDKLTTEQVWSLWKNGGYISGVKYLGMQDVVNQIRIEGAHNLVWVEGAYGARKLPPTNNYLLQGNNIVYDIHHPNLNLRESWTRIASLSTIQPVVDGEWAQYQSNWAECYSKAYFNAPAYLNFLRSHKIGVIAWSLQTDSLVAGDGRLQPNNINTRNDPVQASDLKDPSDLKSNYTCGDGRHGQGVGRLLKDYFYSNSDLSLKI